MNTNMSHKRLFCPFQIIVYCVKTQRTYHLSSEVNVDIRGVHGRAESACIAEDCQDWPRMIKVYCGVTRYFMQSGTILVDFREYLSTFKVPFLRREEE